MSVLVRLLADSPLLPQNRKASISFKISNKGGDLLSGTPYIVVRRPPSSEPALYAVFDEISIPPSGEATLSVDLDLIGLEGEIEVEASYESEGKVLASDSRRFYVYSEGPPIHVAFVWHFHQAPQFRPSGVYKDEWPFLHVYNGSFYGYKGGPYSVHVQLHQRVPGWRDVDHFSPSLLEQWVNAVERGYRTAEINVPPGDARVLAVKEVLDSARAIAAEGGAELLGSVYAHTILGFLLQESEKRGIGRLARFLISWELQEGLRIVQQVLGNRPRGVWTPEMFWHMHLVKIYRESGVEYTVLCEQHFNQASGDKGTIYEPYIVRDEEGNEIVVFFRDLALSDWISFKADFKSVEEAEEAAWNFVIELAKRRAAAPGGIVVVALDGENWMIMPDYRRYGSFFLEKLALLITRSSIIKVTTLSEYLRHRPPTKVLRYIPAGSWIRLSDAQWVGGVKSETWAEVMSRLEPVEALLESLGEDQLKILLQNRVEPVYSVFKAAAISLDSDFYWYGELEKERSFVIEWAREAEKLALSLLSSVRAEVRKLNEHLLEVKLVNPTELRLSFSIKAGADSLAVFLEPSSEKRIFFEVHSTPLELRAGGLTLARLA
ncbi:MAG: glycoside hydrolase family 57 protein [Thermofilum sp.]